MKTRITALLLASVLISTGSLARAQNYPPPLPPQYHHLVPVAWVVHTRNNLDDDDRYVTMIGQVTGRIGDNEYWFSDGTGSVRLDAGDRHLPVGARVIIGGRVDQAFLGIGNLEVDVRRWQFAGPYHS